MSSIPSYNQPQWVWLCHPWVHRMRLCSATPLSTSYTQPQWVFLGRTQEFCSPLKPPFVYGPSNRRTLPHSWRSLVQQLCFFHRPAPGCVGRQGPHVSSAPALLVYGLVRISALAADTTVVMLLAGRGTPFHSPTMFSFPVLTSLCAASLAHTHTHTHTPPNPEFWSLDAHSFPCALVFFVVYMLNVYYYHKFTVLFVFFSSFFWNVIFFFIFSYLICYLSPVDVRPKITPRY